MCCKPFLRLRSTQKRPYQVSLSEYEVAQVREIRTQNRPRQLLLTKKPKINGSVKTYVTLH